MATGRARIDLAMTAALLRAPFELAWARLRLATRGFNAVKIDAAVAADRPNPAQSAMIDRIAFAVPRIAARVPWRSDCLVQALAAQRWLGSAGIASTLHLGTPKTPTETFEAHAWLVADERIVTGGGEIDHYIPLRGRPG